MNVRNSVSALLACMTLLQVSCGQQSQTVTAPIRVKVIQANTEQPDGTRKYTGTTETQTATVLSFGNPGTVRNVYVTEGQDVTTGQILADMDDSSWQGTVATAKALLDQAQDAYDRLKGLHETRSISDIQWVEAESRLTQARAAYDIAMRQLEGCTIKAPADGTVSSRNIEPGQYCIPSVQAISVVSRRDMLCSLSIPEKEIMQFKNGMKARIEVPALGNGGSFTGTVVKVGTVADFLTHTYAVSLEMDDKSGRIRPGMICSATFGNISKNKSDTIMVIPANAVQLDADNSRYVWIAQGDSIASRRSIVTGAPTAAGITVLSGIEPGENVIIEGLLKISQGCQIEIAE